MRNVLITGLLAFVAIVGAVYPITWYIKAITIESAIEDTAEHLRTLGMDVSYDAISVSGFPTEMVVSIEKPRLRGRVDTLLNHITTAEPSFADMKPWQTDLLLDGTLQLSVDMFSSLYQMHVNGSVQEQDLVDGKEVSLAWDINDGQHCALQVESNPLSALLWDFRLGEDDRAVWVEDFRSLDCHHSGFMMLDNASQNVLMQSGPVRFYVSKTPKDGKNTVRFFADYHDVEVLPAGDHIISLYQRLFNDAPAAALSASGKNQLKIDLSYDGPTNHAENDSIPLHIQLNTLHVSNQLYRFDATFGLSNSTQNDSKSGTLSFDVESTTSEAYDAVNKEALRAAIAEIQTSNDPELQNLSPYLQGRSVDQIMEIIDPIVPDLHSFGTLHSTLDLQYAFNKNLQTGNAQLKAFGFSATPYGLNAKGSIEHQGNLPIPTSDFTLECRACPALIDDAGAYSIRLQQVLQTLSPGQGTLISDKEVAALKGFLTELAGPAAGDVFTYHVVSEPMGLDINGRNLGELFQLYGRYMKPEQEG